MWRKQLRPWSSLRGLGDEELFQLFMACPWAYTDETTVRPTSVRRIAADAVVKMSAYPLDGEVTAQVHVWEHTSILLPEVYRTGAQGDCYWMVMEHVEGEALSDCWHRLHWVRKGLVLLTLRRYIRELRRTRPPGDQSFPGRLGTTPGKCYGSPFIFQPAGPFNSAADMGPYFDRRLRGSERVEGGPKIRPPLDLKLPLVLTHLDLHGKNIMLDRGGRVWVLDWGLAGMYPRCFEFISMMWMPWMFVHVAEKWIYGFIAGWYFLEYELWCVLDLDNLMG
ncbi:kinase-like domain-containing protein [Ganoderma leucocontextum]|nr:kinase-like domain-containing protein [Ganoderma leucocontextum]KAI1787580.1 kinase-like domain-containing protein [Ganoderma leucocontextum]KAI1787752.1 kinase-like domain-containing protein [Ganoderma leucocontextum]KAI1789284.1 kinase-like domain-containing protein [Ganoderma leucocontextum]KAI1790690.1 kinase-like domain-containing protein [Ganoderma leucocontextum]